MRQRHHANRSLLLISTGIVVLSLFPATSPAQESSTETAKQASPPTGAITGRVISRGGESLTDARVYLATPGLPAPPRSVPVDDGGNFRIDSLESGNYMVWATLPGFVSDTPAWASEPRPFYRPGDSVTFTLIKGGIITGSVRAPTNLPVVLATVRAFRIRDENGQPVQGVIQFRERFTDDRGVYRIYGLQPGIYLVSVGGPSRFFGGPSVGPYDNDAPTYAPSSTRDTAIEISVRSGEESTADIQYRGDPGHAISGSLAGVPQTSSGFSAGGTINLTDVRSRAVIMSAPTGAYNNNTFAFYGIADGEYELSAQRMGLTGESSAAPPRRLKMQGADITGINLNLVPLASIAGRIVLESNPPSDCVKNRATALQETAVIARRINQENRTSAARTQKAESAPEIPLAFANAGGQGVPDAKGDFTIRNLYAGSFRVDPQTPSPGWYVRSITIAPPNQATTGRTAEPNVARDGITLKSGERASGLSITFTEGAATLRGRVSPPEGQRLPPRLQVFLVPVERESADNVLKFFETRADSEGNFAVGSIAPGRYWIIARVAEEKDPTPVKSIRQDAALRATVLREAQALKTELQVKPCEQTSDYDLRYGLSVNPPEP